MEFEDMQKIWDSQNQQHLYTINETAMYNYIASKKKKTFHIANVSELSLITINLVTGSVLLAMSASNWQMMFFPVLTAAWMYITAAYVLIHRIGRRKSDKQFDKSIFGNLTNAISTATYQLRLSMIMRWNIVPIAILSCWGVWNKKHSIEITGLILLVFVFAAFASKWEYGIYKGRKRDLETLRNKLAH